MGPLNGIAALEQANHHPKIRHPNCKIERIQLAHQVQLPAEQLIERPWRRQKRGDGLSWRVHKVIHTRRDDERWSCKLHFLGTSKETVLTAIYISIYVTIDCRSVRLAKGNRVVGQKTEVGHHTNVPSGALPRALAVGAGRPVGCRRQQNKQTVMTRGAKTQMVGK